MEAAGAQASAHPPLVAAGNESLPALGPGDVWSCPAVWPSKQPHTVRPAAQRAHGPKEVHGAAATSETWVRLLSRSAEAERTVFICQAPESDRDGPGFGGDVSGGSGL